MKSRILWLGAIVAVTILLIRGLSLLQRNTSPVSSDNVFNRPFIVGVVSWPGYAGGIVANRGFQENTESIFYKKYGLPVRFVLIEDIDARGKAFAKGGPDGVDVVWTTVDFWANELPQFIDGGIDAKAFLQVDWSRGGDAIVATDSIQTIEDLAGKKIALVQFTPSHWLLESALRESRLVDSEKEKIRDSLIFTQDVSSARATFIAGQVDAAVVWEPDVKQALKRKNSHVLLSTREKPEIIADVLVAKQEFLTQYPETIEKFVRGWLEGVAEAKQNPDLAAQMLIENEPLFSDLGFEATKDSLSWVYWPTIDDNAIFFGVDGSTSTFDTLFRQASTVWTELGVITKQITSGEAKYDQVIRKLYAEK